MKAASNRWFQIAGCILNPLNPSGEGQLLHEAGDIILDPRVGNRGVQWVSNIVHHYQVDPKEFGGYIWNIKNLIKIGDGQLAWFVGTVTINTLPKNDFKQIYGFYINGKEISLNDDSTFNDRNTIFFDAIRLVDDASQSVLYQVSLNGNLYTGKLTKI